MDESGWKSSAKAWIADMGENGDFGRQHVLDKVMIERLSGLVRGTALDVGCGEGRFCRILRGQGFETVGLDPTEALLDAARARDPGGVYVEGRAETLVFANASFDLVVSYLSLIDIEDAQTAIAEMARVLKPGGTLLIANLASFKTAAVHGGWQRDLLGRLTHFAMDRYLETRSSRESWRGISIRNWHRPLSDYMRWFLTSGLILTHFDEPPATGGDPAKAERYNRAPWYVVMEWRKPA